MATINFFDGPCDRTTETVSATFASDSIECGGAKYQLYKLATGDWLAVPPGTTVNQTLTPGHPRLVAGPDVLKTSDALQAWDRAAHALVHGMPLGLRAAAESAQRIRRIG